MKNKYLVESARITDAYFRMYSKNINEAIAGDAGNFTKGIGNNSQFTGGVAKGVPGDAGKFTKGIGNNSQFTGGVVKGVAGDAGKFTKGIGDKGKFIDGIAKAPGKMVGNSANGVAGDAGKFTKEIEYPENGDVEYTGEEEDYLEGKTNVRPKTLAPDAREKYRKTFESCGKKRGCGKKVDEVADGKPHVDPVDIYTIQISRVLDNGDQEGIDEMKYAKTYYDIHDAIEDAKNAYAEYADGEDNIVVDILAGEQEHESGDIWGEPYVILTVKDGKLLDATGAEVDTTEEEFIGNIDSANESYDDNGEVDYGDDNSMHAEDLSDDQLKNAISVIKKICAKYGARVTGISEGDSTHAIINIKIKDPNKTPGVGFDMNRIMGIGYGIERACEKAGIDAHIAGGYVGNNTQLYLNKAFPIIESAEEERKYGIMNGAGDWFLNGTAQEITGEEFGPDAESAFRFTHDGAYKNLQQWQNNGDDEEYEVRILPPTNEEILAQYRKYLGNAMPVVETKEGEIYFEYDPKRNVLAYGGASNTGLLEMGSMEYDKNTTVQENLIRLSEEIYEKYGYPDEE